MTQNVTSLNQLLDVMEKSAEGSERVSLREVIEAIGSRSLGPLLLLAGLITLVPPIGGIPGVPIAMGFLVMLVAVQLLFHKKHPWLPNWLLNRSIAKEKFSKALQWSRKPARFIDRVTRARLTSLVEGKGHYLIALMCVVIAAMMPPMELVPFSAVGAGLALSALGVALISRDGAVALAAIIIVLLLAGLMIFKLMGSG